MTAIVVLYARPEADLGSTVPFTFTNAPSFCWRPSRNCRVFATSGNSHPKVLCKTTA